MTKTPEELTKEWKAGKLPQWKFYYVSYSGGVEPLLLNGENDFINHSRIINSLVKSILSPVPPYDEYKAMQYQIADANKKVENLGYLLKECKRYIDFCCVPDGFGKSYIAEDLLTRINAAIGEIQASPVADIKIQESEE